MTSTSGVHPAGPVAFPHGCAYCGGIHESPETTPAGVLAERNGLPPEDTSGVAGILHDNGFTWDDANAVDAILSHFGLIVSKSATPAGVLDEAGEAATREFIESVTVFRDVDAALVNATLAELSESPLPGAKYAYEVVKRRFAAALSGPARETTLDEAALRAIPMPDWHDKPSYVHGWDTAMAAVRAALGRSGSGVGRG